MQILRSWREQQVMLKRKFSMLSDKDFEFKEGQRENIGKDTIPKRCN